MDIEKENVVQAVVIMDTFNNNLIPITNDKPLALCKVAGVPLIDYMLESLAHGGVGEAVLCCCRFGVLIKEHIRKCIKRRAPWTMVMTTKVMMSDACRTMGDVMRELDRAEIVKGYFILTGVNTITNIPLASLLEKHIQMCRKDKGAAMTLVFKEVAWDHPLIRSDKTVLLTVDAGTNKVIVHKKYKTKNKDKKVTIPLETFLQHSEGKSYHHLADANIALCSPSVLPLFSDNFDFQSRDDFIHGILINEEILASSLYYTLLKSQHYAAAVTNWKTYQIVSNDIMHLWAHPLSIDTGSFQQNQFKLTFDHNFRSKSSVLSRSCELLGNVLIGAKTKLSDNTVLSNAVVGEYCNIGSNVIITGSHIMNNVVIKENCKIINSFVDDNCVIEENCTLENGTMIGSGVTISCNTQMNGNILKTENQNEHARTKSTSESGTDWENESSGSETDDFVGFNESWSDSDTCYSTDSSESSLHCSPVPEDTNIFLQEVIDSLARGYDDKLVCDNLILEINSSRYAYNIQLNEVNFFVVKAILSLPVITESTKVLSTVKDVLKYFRPVLANYIKTKSSIMDCLKAVEESCIKCDWLHGKAGQLIHLLYDAEVVDEECLLEWHKDLEQEESPLSKEKSVDKFFEWLQEASEESESD